MKFSSTCSTFTLWLVSVLLLVLIWQMKLFMLIRTHIVWMWSDSKTYLYTTYRYVNVMANCLIIDFIHTLYIPQLRWSGNGEDDFYDWHMYMRVYQYTRQRGDTLISMHHDSASVNRFSVMYRFSWIFLPLYNIHTVDILLTQHALIGYVFHLQMVYTIHSDESTIYMYIWIVLYTCLW